jgi:hypothetical protein
MATLGFTGLALSCLAGIIGQFGGNPADLGFLNADGALPVELFAWAFFAVALLFVLRTAAARGASILVRAGAAVCLVGAMLECASVGFSVRTVTAANPSLSLFKAEFAFATLGWLVLATGVFVVQRNWAAGRQMSAARTARGAWQRTLLVVTLAMLCSAGGEALGFGSVVAWHNSTSQVALLGTYGPEVLTWIAVAAAALIVVNAARHGLFARQLVVPAGIAMVGGVVLTVSAAALLTAVELVYGFLSYGWATPLVQTEAVCACVGMLVLAVACIAAASVRQELGPRGRTLPAPPPYWPQVATAPL